MDPILQKRAQEEARQRSESSATKLLGPGIRITDWSPIVLDTLWYDSAFNWEIIIRYPNGPAALEIAIWEDNQLSALALASPAGNRMLLRYVEANPDMASRLKGQRMYLSLDVTTNYAEMTGRTEVRLFPTNAAVRNLCLTELGLESLENGHLRLVLG